MINARAETSLEGWELARIGDRFASWGGHTPSKANPAFWGEGIPWVSSKDVKYDRLSSSTYSVTQVAVEQTGLRICPVGSVLVVVRSGILAHTLPVALTDIPVTINQDLKAFYSDEPWLNEWLALFLRLSEPSLLQHSRREGTTVQSIQYPLLKDTLIPIPPAAQRRQIIDAVELALAHRAAAIPHLGKAKSSIGHFRQAVLAAACSGRLTADWREVGSPATSANDTVASISAKRREQLGRRYQAPLRPEVNGDLPEGWCWTTIGALVDVATGATPLRKRSDYYNGSIPWVTSGAVNAGLITESTEYITELALKETNAKVFPAGTLLVAMYGEGQTRGRVAELGIDAATNQALAALLFDDHSERLRPYLHLFLLENYERIRQLSFGGVQPNLSLGAIRDTALPLPPLEEQFEIVRRVKRLLESADAVSSAIAHAARRVDRTSQAILAKAFRGELVDHPESRVDARRVAVA